MKNERIAINSIIATFIVVFSFLLFYALLFKDVNDKSKDVILFVLGAISTNLTQVVSYYFGSSKGADDKTKIISDMTTNKNIELCTPSSTSA